MQLTQKVFSMKKGNEMSNTSRRRNRRRRQQAAMKLIQEQETLVTNTDASENKPETKTVVNNTTAAPTKTTTFAESYNCHAGNVKIFSIGKGTLYAGGKNHGMNIFGVDIVIDLADTNHDFVSKLSRVRPKNIKAKETFQELIAYEAANNKVPEILVLSIDDFKTPPPSWDKEFWKILTSTIRKELEGGKDILIHCLGGHGRTGLVIAILLKILRPDLLGESDPITYLRKNYCEHSVETAGQIDYVFNFFTDLAVIPVKDRPSPGKRITPASYKTDDKYWQSAWSNTKTSKDKGNGKFDWTRHSNKKDAQERR